MLTYLQVHIFFTIPPTILLWIILRPFINGFDKFKIAFMCVLAVTYTTPWDNYIIYHKAWWYRKDAVLGTIGYVPIEEYFFFVIQTILTALWTILCTRWTLNTLHLEEANRFKFFFVRYSVISALAGVVVWGWQNGFPATKTFYLGSICWWSLPVIGFLWYGTGNFIVKRKFAYFLSLAVPTLYLCLVDLIALRADVWHINEKTSLEWFVYDELPFEEFLFFLVSNSLLVCAVAAFDKSKTVVDTFFNNAKWTSLKNGKEFRFDHFVNSMKGFFTDEIDLPQEVIVDLRNCLTVLNHASKSFSYAANLFSNGKRYP